jgi:hypothetical protein
MADPMVMVVLMVDTEAEAMEVAVVATAEAEAGITNVAQAKAIRRIGQTGASTLRL